MHTDGTSRRQIAILNLIITALEDGNEDATTPVYETILFSASILPEDETAEAQHNAIMDFLDEMGQWLGKWKEAFQRENPGVEHDIDPDGLTMTKLEDGNVMTDGCNTARSVNRKLVETITQLVKEKKKKDQTLGEAVAEAISQSAGAQVAESGDTGTDDGHLNDASAENEEGDVRDARNDAVEGEDEGEDADIEEIEIAYETYCHHHIRNVWWNAINKYLTKHLKTKMADSFDEIDPRLRVQPNMQSILRAIDKCFSLPANYPKGEGQRFKHWMIKYHPDFPLYPVQRSNGARCDQILEGSVAVYMNGGVYLLFLDEALTVPNADNILQENCFIVLSSVELLALSRFYSILHFAVNLPMRWLAGNTHTLASEDWSVASMGRAIDCFFEALQEIEKEPYKFLDETFMLCIFKVSTKRDQLCSSLTV